VLVGATRVGESIPLSWASVWYSAICQQRLPQPDDRNHPILPRQVPQATRIPTAAPARRRTGPFPSNFILLS
jgi:hypothetical protein